MSNIYIQEPPCDGKVLLETSVGEIDVELWSREAPKACRNFIQLCLEGYYDGTIFHRVIKDFIVQGGDPTGTGDGGESIYGKPFRDEIHTRLRFVRRGLVAMANAGQHDNGSQFFFTMGPTQELQNKHTIFGKVGGDTIYNMIRLQEVEVDANDRPVYPMKIKRTKVLSNPFEDIVPRVTKKEAREEKEDKKNKSKATKNYSLLSFGEEAEEDEEENIMVSKEMKGKSKSSHDLTDDPKLSSVPAVKVSKRKSKVNDDNEESDEEENERVKESIKKKLRTENEKKKSDTQNQDKDDTNSQSTKSSRSEELRKEAKQLAKEIMKSRQKPKEEAKEEEKKKTKEPANELVASYLQEKKKYVEMKKNQGKKGSSREAATLALLSKFKNKLHSVKIVGADYDDEEEEENEKEEGQISKDEDEDDIGDLSWMRHKLKFDDNSRRVIDANVKELDRYEIYDPRNPLTQRRREASKQAMKAKK